MTRETARYQLTVSGEQADLINRALEFYERVGGLGQFEVAVEPWLFRCDANKLEAARRALDQVKLHLTGFGYGASYGIYSPEVPDEHRVAYDLQQVIRYRLAWDRTPEGGLGVWFSEPYQTSQVPLAKIEQIAASPSSLASSPAPERLAHNELAAIRARVARYAHEQLGQAATDRARLVAEVDALRADRDRLQSTLPVPHKQPTGTHEVLRLLVDQIRPGEGPLSALRRLIADATKAPADVPWCRRCGTSSECLREGLCAACAPVEAASLRECAAGVRALRADDSEEIAAGMERHADGLEPLSPTSATTVDRRPRPAGPAPAEIPDPGSPMRSLLSDCLGAFMHGQTPEQGLELQRRVRKMLGVLDEHWNVVRS